MYSSTLPSLFLTVSKNTVWWGLHLREMLANGLRKGISFSQLTTSSWVDEWMNEWMNKYMSSHLCKMEGRGNNGGLEDIVFMTAQLFPGEARPF